MLVIVQMLASDGVGICAGILAGVRSVGAPARRYADRRSFAAGRCRDAEQPLLFHERMTCSCSNPLSA